jgi:hypothetical protein
MEEFAAVRLAGRTGLGRPDLTQAMTAGRWLLHRRLGNRDAESVEHELLVVDQALQPVWRLRPPPVPVHWAGTYAVADDLSLVALALPREVRLVHGDGRPVADFPYPTEEDRGYAAFSADGRHLELQFPGRDEAPTLDADGQVVARGPWSGLGEAGGCAFTADGRWLWACVPHKGEGDELWLIDLGTLTVADRRTLGSDSQLVLPYRHPDGQALGLNLWAGHDAVLRWAKPADGRIELRRLPEPAVLRDLHPAGEEYLATPLDQADQPLPMTRRRYPDGRVLGRLAEWEWEATAGYLTAELLVAEVWRPDLPGRNRHLLLRREPLGVLGWVRYPDADGGLPGHLSRCRAGMWLTFNDDGVEGWGLAQPPSPLAGSS